MPRRSAWCVALLLTTTAGAQWQLPPGTSSSTEPGVPMAQASSAATIAKAEQLLEAQDWRAALALLRPTVQREPANAHAQYDLGFALEGVGDIAAAQTAYEAAAAADAGLVSARVSLGLLLARQGDATGANRWLRSAIALPETEATRGARAQAGRALARLDLPGAPERARDELVAAIRLSEERPEDTQLAAEIAEALHDDAAAERAYARLLAGTAADADTIAGYTRVLLRQGKLAEAEATLRRGLAAHPGNVLLLSEEADLLLGQRKYADAIPLLEQMHASDGDNAAVTRLLARAYVAAGTPQKADPLFAALLRTSSGDAVLQVDWADCLIRQKRNAEAQAVLEHALTLPFPAPSAKAEAAAKLAFAAAANHQPEIVVRAVQLRDAILPPDAVSTFLLATAHDTLHHTAQAAQSYRSFLDLAAGSYPDEVWQAQQRLQVLRRAK